MLFVLAHIRMPEIVRQAEVSDKTLHILAYMVLVFLMWGAISPYQKVNWRQATVWWLLLVVVGYGIIDEWLQGYAGRTPDAKDFLADLGGTMISLGLLSFLDFWLAATILSATTLFMLNCLTRADLTTLLPAANSLLHFFGYGLLTALWIRYRSHCRPEKPGRWGQAPWALLVAMGVLAIIKSIAWTQGKRPALVDLLIAATGIAMAMVASSLAHQDGRK
jgi:VanZ family protein